MRRLRLVKVTVQAHFVVDDGEVLEERIARPVEVSAADWPAYARRGFDVARAAVEAELNEAEPEAEPPT